MGRRTGGREAETVQGRSATFQKGGEDVADDDKLYSSPVVCLGAGVVGSLGFGAYYLGNNSDVVLKKKSLNQDGPWNLIPQHHNSKRTCLPLL